MSVSVSRSDGLTMLTLTTDPSSSCPPLCQLLGALCYSPGLCSKSYGLSPQRGGPQAALGALWIITGVMHIGLGSILIATRYSETVVLTWYSGNCPIWLGVLFMFFGVCCVLSERYPRRILVLLNGLLNLAGAALSITAIVLYSCALGSNRYSDYSFRYNCETHYWDPLITTPPNKSALRESCEGVRNVMWMITISVLSVLVILSVLDLCVALSSATLRFKAWRRNKSRKSKATSQE